MSDAIEALHKFCYTYHECGYKPGKLLSHQLRQSSNLNNITQIDTSSGTTINPSNINNQFRDFYSYLYTSENSTEESHLESFLKFSRHCYY